MASKPTTPTAARIEVFRPGTFKPMEGAELSFSAADLKAAADAYDFSTAPAPIVVGHPSTDAPAFGWADAFEFDATNDRLYATLKDIDPAFSEAVQSGRYKKVSLSFFRPDHSNNPVPGTWYPKHIGFLGGAAPAVSGLKNVQFSIPEGEAATFTASFGEWGFERSARIMQGMREWIIEKFGMDEADKALPAYEIEWLGDTEIQKDDRSFADKTTTIPPKKEATLPKDPDPAFATREADVAAREAKLAEREAKITHDDNVSFAEGLVTDGRLLPASKDKVVAILDALPEEASVSFAGGEAKQPPAAALRAVLKEQPKVVSFGRAELPAPGSDAAVAFASDGKQVDGEQLELHSRASAYQRQNPGTAWLDAVRAVS